MASKKDLIEAQGFSRRRLLTAFTSGAPGGKELEPAKPLRAVIAGIALSVMVIVGGVFYGLMNPGLKDGWQNNTVVLVKNTGARYVAIDGTLYPVINATSARLAIPAADYKVITTTSSAISSIPVGPAIGILGAPDDVPAADALVADAWTACPTADGTALSIPGTAAAAATHTAALVRSDGHTYVVAAGTAYLVDAATSDAVLRAVGLSGIKPLNVDSKWLNLFAAGAPLEPLMVVGAGEAVVGTTLLAGTAVHPQNSADHFIVTAKGTLAPLNPLAFQLYLLGTGARGAELEVTSGEIRNLLNDVPAGGVDWPVDVLTPVAPGASVCAVLGHDARLLPTTTLATTMAPPTGTSPTIAPGAGALVAAGGQGLQATREVYVVDQSGTSFGVPHAKADLLAQLGYTDTDVKTLTTAWMQFFASGPELTVAGARSSPEGSAGTNPAGPVLPTPTSSANPNRAATPPPSKTSLPAPSVAALLAPSPGAQPTQGAASADASGNGKCEQGAGQLSADPPKTFNLLQVADLAPVATGKGVTVAVVDSGIDATNPHLNAAVIGGVNLVADGERADGMSDRLGHGTSVAGVIAARAVTGSGMVGLAPDAKLLSVRVYRGTDKETVKAGFGPDVRLMAQGIRWSVDNGATIVNVSMSGEDDAVELRDAVAYATEHGVLVVASAGNRNTAANQLDSLRYPAADPGVLGVAAVNLDGDVTEASIHGVHVDVAAPGQSVLSVQAGGGDCVFASDAESASYATAYTSAAAALLAQAHPEESPAQWSYRLMATAIRFNPEARNDLAGWGVIQPLDAITVVPGSGERGPVSPFTDNAPVTIDAATTVVSPHRDTSPFLASKQAVLGMTLGAATALATLGVFTAYRRRPQSQPTAAGNPARPGLLDTAKSDLTRLR